MFRDGGHYIRDYTVFVANDVRQFTSTTLLSLHSQVIIASGDAPLKALSKRWPVFLFSSSIKQMCYSPLPE